jgi:uncharacterized protein YggL (DUF469 family)
MEYQGSYPRYVQYSKGTTNLDKKNNVQRGTIEYTRFGSEYFSGANVGVYFGDVLVDQIKDLQFNLQEQVIPIFGYGSYTYDAVAKGQRLINGSFDIYFREAGYLKLILDRIEVELGGAGKTNPFKYDTVPEETTIEHILEELSSKSGDDFDKLASNYEKAIWGELDNDEIYTDDGGKKPYFIPLNYTGNSKVTSGGFDILISYGPEARRQKKNLGELSAKTTVQSINGVHITSVELIVNERGEPIFERYTFMARDINANIHKRLAIEESPVVVKHLTLKFGSNGQEVKDLQKALQKFIDHVINLECQNNNGFSAFLQMLKGNKYLSSGTIKVDGDFGNVTREAVKVFQDYYDLSADGVGVAGNEVWEQLSLEEFI